MTELPCWVWDLIADLVDEEAVHPPLFTSRAEPYDCCLQRVLNCIPDETLRVAEHIARYRREVKA